MIVVAGGVVSFAVLETVTLPLPLVVELFAAS